MDVAISSTYCDRQMNRIHVVDVAENFDRINPEHWYKIIGTDLMINKKAKGKVAIVDYAKREEIIWVVDKEFIIKYGSYMLQLDRLFDVEVIENRIQELDEYLNSKI